MHFLSVCLSRSWSYFRWMHDDKKMSKSLGNVVDPSALIAKFGVCSVRYFLLSETTLSRDGDFSESALIRRVNSELSDTLGNLAHRVLSLVQKNYEGVVPGPVYNSGDHTDSDWEKDEELLSLAERVLESGREVIAAESDLHKVIHSVMKIPREGMSSPLQSAVTAFGCWHTCH